MDYLSADEPDARPHYSYIVGVDLGQSHDFSAVLVVRMIDGIEVFPNGFGHPSRVDYFPEGARYELGHIERIPLGTKYPHVVTHVRDVITTQQAERPRRAVALVVDRTGVGRAVGDLMTRDSVGVAPTLVTITGGDTVTKADDGGYGVPKRELASVTQAVLQTGRLAFAADQPFLKELKAELAGFRATIKLSGHVSFEAGEDWRSEEKHDDLVLGLALALWAGERAIGTGRFEEASPELGAMLKAMGL